MSNLYLVCNFLILTEKEKRTVILPWNENSDSGDFPVIPVCVHSFIRPFQIFTTLYLWQIVGYNSLCST